MAGLRRLFDHPRLLANDSSLCRAVACAAPLAIYRAAARMDGDVDRDCPDHAALAERLAISNGLGMEPRSHALRRRSLCIFAIREEFQRKATRRPARNSRHKPRAAAS